MDFEALYKRISPRLEKIARYLDGRVRFIDKDDLYQEMCAYLWDKYGNGVPEGINDSYIAKGCEFHVRNFLRCEREGATLMSMESPVDSDGNTLADLLPDNAESIDRDVDRRITMEEIRNNGFSKREKEVFSLLLEGHTVREAGAILRISHVAVVKSKNNVIRKWREENN